MTRIISIVGGLQPSAPTIGTATAGDTTASVAFTASSYIGKGTITYTATSSPGGLTATGASSPLTVTGLTNGTAYTFTVVGNTNYGVASVASAASNSITPATQSSYESIATVTVGSGGSSSITFSSIPATYTHLQIRMLTSTVNPTGSMTMNFNSDNASANYRNHNLFGSGSAVFSNTDGNAEYVGLQGGAMTTGPGVQIIDILDYKNTNKYTTSRFLSGYDANGSGYIFYGSSLWMNTAAVNQIVISRNTSGFFQYSHFALYGIKGA